MDGKNYNYNKEIHIVGAILHRHRQHQSNIRRILVCRHNLFIGNLLVIFIFIVIFCRFFFFSFVRLFVLFFLFVFPFFLSLSTWVRERVQFHYRYTYTHSVCVALFAIWYTQNENLPISPNSDIIISFFGNKKKKKIQKILQITIINADFRSFIAFQSHLW